MLIRMYTFFDDEDVHECEDDRSDSDSTNWAHRETLAEQVA